MVIRRTMGLTGQIAPRALAAVLIVLGLVGTGCSSEGLRSGDAATVADGSTAQVAVGGEEWQAFEACQQVPEGARVRADGGETVLRFRNGAVRLAAGSTAVVTRDGIELSEGDALIDGVGGLAATLADTTVVGDGTFRVSSGLSSRVAVYSGTATVSRPSQSRDVPALRELDLSAFRLAATADPLQYHGADAWDQELLGEAIAFDGEAARLTGGIDIEIGRAPLKPRFYSRFAGDEVVRFLDEAATVRRRGAFGPPSDVLLTIFVSRAAAGSLGRSVQHVAALRDAGAKWGLITLDLKVASDQVVAAFDGLGNRRLATAARDAAVTPRARQVAARAASDATAAGTAEVAGAAGTTTSLSSGSTGGGSTTTPPAGGSGGGGGTGGGGTGGGGGGGGGGNTVEQVVSDVVTAVEDPTGGDDPGSKSPVEGVKVPQLP